MPRRERRLPRRERRLTWGGKKGAGASIRKAENGKHNDAEPVLEWKLQQVQFACCFAELITSPTFMGRYRPINMSGTG